MQKWNLILNKIISELLCCCCFYLVYMIYFRQRANYEFPLINKINKVFCCFEDCMLSSFNKRFTVTDLDSVFRTFFSSNLWQ